MKQLFLVALLALAACAQPAPPPQPPSQAAQCAAPLKPGLEVGLYFGRDKPGGGQVSEAEWTAFLADVVTPRFPDGLSVVDAGGQFRAPSGRIVRERSKLVVVIVFDAPLHRVKIGEVVETYKQRFGQHSVLQTEQPICAGL